jgi:hypothetical protein
MWIDCGRDVARSGSPQELIADLRSDNRVAVYCSWGFDVGGNVTKTLIERGFDARLRLAARDEYPRQGHYGVEELYLLTAS